MSSRKWVLSFGMCVERETQAENEMSAIQKTRFVVIGEHSLAYVMATMPNTAFILAGSVSRPLNIGEAYPIFGATDVRPATRGDFETFRVSTEGYETCPHHDFPEN